MPTDTRQKWLVLFSAVIVLELSLTAFGILLGTGGHALGEEMQNRMEALTQVFQSVTALSVVACIVVGRARLTPEIVQTPEHLMRETMICLAVGEMAILLGLIGLAKLHVAEFLVTTGLLLLVQFGFVLPRCLKLISGLSDRKN